MLVRLAVQVSFEMVAEIFKFVRFQQDSTARFADGLQDRDYGPEVSNVEDRELEIDETEMTDAIDESEAASAAFSVFAARTESAVQNSVWSGFPA